MTTKTKPKQAFRSTWNAFNKLLQNLKNNLFNGIFYWLTALMPSDKCNSIMAKATGLIFSLFGITSAWEYLFGILQYVQCILHGLTSVLLCVPFIFANSEYRAWVFYCRVTWSLRVLIISNRWVLCGEIGSGYARLARVTEVIYWYNLCAWTATHRDKGDTFI